MNVSVDIGKKYDVVIAGGGLAGLSLAMQLKRKKSILSVLVLEKRAEKAEVATHKVGESTVELGSFYLREIIGLKDYLETKHIIKLGFRYFFTYGKNSSMEKRVELGPKMPRPIPTHQIDRGILENDLIEFAKKLGVSILLNSKVTEVSFAEENNEITFQSEGKTSKVNSHWVIDATGRNAFLKKKFSLNKDFDHPINAFWFRVNKNIDVDDFSSNMEWKNLCIPDQRRLATNHLMGKGYWVWIIPLSSNCTSIGVVADKNYHAFESLNTIEKVLAWSENHEPDIAKVITENMEGILDFKVMKQFAYDIQDSFSMDRWAVTGDSGAFMDAFYSPGTDFIALSNSWITDLIVSDFNKEDISVKMLIYASMHKEMLKNWLPLYRNKYSLFGSTQIMIIKLMWDWASYWSFPVLLFMNDGYTNTNIIKELFSAKGGAGSKFKLLNQRMQQFFEEWSEFEFPEVENGYLDLFDLKFFNEIHFSLTKSYSTDELITQANYNLTVLEQVALEAMSRTYNYIHDNESLKKINPYFFSLKEKESKVESNISYGTEILVSDSIAKDIDLAWLIKSKSLS